MEVVLNSLGTYKDFHISAEFSRQMGVWPLSGLCPNLILVAAFFIMSSRRKRPRLGPGGPSMVRARRPIDKELKTVLQSITNSATTTTLKTVTFPGTVVGLRWNLSFVNIITTTDPVVAWAIVLIQDGESANTPSLSDGADFYTPEQNVLAHGITFLADKDATTGPSVVNFEGSTRAMRKMKQGDVLQLVGMGNTANCATLMGVVQFFFKT